MKLFKKLMKEMTLVELKQFVECWNNLHLVPESRVGDVGLDAGKSMFLQDWMESNIPFDRYDIVEAFGTLWLMAVHPGPVREGHPEDFLDNQSPSVVPRTMTCRWFHPMPPKKRGQ